MARRLSCAKAPNASMTAGVFMGPYDITAIIEMSKQAMSKQARSAIDHRGNSHGSTHLPELGEELQLQRLGEIRHAARTAGAGLVADDALHGLEVMEAPELEFLVEVHQPFRHLVEIPVLLGVVVNA